MHPAPADADSSGDQVLLGLGANLGDPVAQLALAVELLRAHVRVERVSGVYRTQPVGHAEQPDFYNLAVAGRTGLEPMELLAAAKAIEEGLGRVRSFPNAPRLIDVDLLAHGERVMRTPALTLPHPRLHLRGFVLHPLAEIAPQWRHPILGRTPGELLAAATGLERVQPLGALSVDSGPPVPPSGGGD